MQCVICSLAVSLYCAIYSSEVTFARPVMLYSGDGFGVDDDLYANESDVNAEIDFDDDSKGLRHSSRYSEAENVEQPHQRDGNFNMSVAPEYMLELYEKLSKTPSNQNSNIIRSFKNIPHYDGNSTHSQENFNNYRVHSLVFDLSALDINERVKSAELRLFTLIKRDQRSYIGVSRMVSLYEVISIPNTHIVKYNFVTSKYIYSVESAWETFEVTSSVKRLLQQGLRIKRFELRIQSLYMEETDDNMNIIEDPNDTKQPILVVYSNDNSQEHESNTERHELLLHELETRGSTNIGINHNLDSIHSREKRRAYNRVCQRRPLYVDFGDIGWDKWIIAPPGYQAYQCAGKCNLPLGENTLPSKHAIIQAIMHAHQPKRAARACCVPTKLDPISILYEYQDVVTFKYRYEGMVVAECGCR